MIKTKEDLKHYLVEDAKANEEPYVGLKQKIKWFINPRLRFTRNLRFYEYYSNQPQNPYNKLMALWHYYIHKKLSYKLGYTIYKNTFKEGVIFCHYGILIVNSKARIGKNCRIHAEVNVGGFNGGAPQIAENVYIGPGSKLFGPIKIGRNASIGAGAIVRTNIPPYAIVAGNPAKIVGYNFTPEQIIEREKELYPEEERIPLKTLQRNYDKYFANREKVAEMLSLY